MKKLFSIFLLILSLNIFAGEIVVYDISEQELGYSDMSGKFDYNKDLGRAWVVVSFSPSYTEGPVIYDERAKVKGLRLNADLDKVILETEAREIVCATLKKTLFGTTLKETGNCTFKNISYSFKRDNGYEIETVFRKKLVLSYK